MKARWTALVTVALWAVVVPQAGAAERSVNIQGSAFSPQSLQVANGDTVTWTNSDALAHSVKSTAGFFDSPTLGSGQSFSFTFTQQGSYAYFCSIHPSMTAEIRVPGAGSPPDAPQIPRARPGRAVGEIDLTWLPPASDGGTAIAEYRVCRHLSGSGSMVCVQVPGLAYTDTGHRPLSTIRYTVTALNGWGLGPPTAQVCSKPYPWVESLGCL